MRKTGVQLADGKLKVESLEFRVESWRNAGSRFIGCRAGEVAERCADREIERDMRLAVGGRNKLRSSRIFPFPIPCSPFPIFIFDCRLQR